MCRVKSVSISAPADIARRLTRLGGEIAVGDSLDSGAAYVVATRHAVIAGIFACSVATKATAKMRVASAACLAALASTASAFTATVRPSAARHYAATSTTLNMAEKLSQDELKKMVGYKSVDDYVKSGMVVGLGTGSTAYFAVERVGELLKSGELKDIVCIPTSVRTKEQAESLDIPLVTLDTHSKLDVAIDGADEVDPDLNLVKGGGGALLREKMVEVCADKFIVIGEFFL